MRCIYYRLPIGYSDGEQEKELLCLFREAIEIHKLSKGHATDRVYNNYIKSKHKYLILGTSMKRPEYCEDLNPYGRPLIDISQYKNKFIIGEL